MTRIYLIRHAEAEGNLYRRAHGQYDSLVTDKGKQQIEQLAKRFEGEDIAAVYSSDLNRARTTAGAIYKSRGLQVITTARLREANLGEWEGMPWGEMEYRTPELLSNFSNDPANWKVRDGEDFHKVQERMVSMLKEIGARHDGKTVAAFSHGFAIRSFMCAVLGIPSNETSKVAHCDNTAVTLLHYENGELTIQYMGDNSHLDKGSSTFEKQKFWREDGDTHSENLRYLPYDETRDAELVAALSRESGGAKFKDTASIEKHAAAHPEAVMTAFLGDTPAGIVELDIESCAFEGVGRIAAYGLTDALYCDEMNIQLIGQAVATFRSLGRERLRLEVRADDVRMAEFYPECGFVKIGETRREDGMYFIMEKDIARRFTPVGVAGK